jgi:hypothetical protein
MLGGVVWRILLLNELGSRSKSCNSLNEPCEPLLQLETIKNHCLDSDLHMLLTLDQLL